MRIYVDSSVLLQHILNADPVLETAGPSHVFGSSAMSQSRAVAGTLDGGQKHGPRLTGMGIWEYVFLYEDHG